jgi:phage gpG-like protein
VNIEVAEEATRKSGNELRNAAAVTSSEGHTPGRMVRKRGPDQSRISDGEVLEQALSDQADLDMAVVGGQLATYSGTITFGLMVHELCAAVA